MGSQAPDPRYGDSHGMLRKIFSLQLTGSLTAPLAPLPLQEGVSCHCWSGRPWSRVALWQAHGQGMHPLLPLPSTSLLGSIWDQSGVDANIRFPALPQ